MIDLQADREQSYEAVRRAPSEIQEHLETLVDVVLAMNARRVIELGVRFGYSTNALLYALGLTGGHLWSVDVDRRFTVVDPIWTFVQGDDLDLSVLAQLPRDVDVVFIDTGHSYVQTLSEVGTYRGLVRSGGVIIVHGTEVMTSLGSEPPYPLRRAVDKLLPSDEYSRTHLTGGQGLTIVTVP